MITNKNNTISDELKEEIYRVSSKLVDAQSDINDTYKYLLKRLLGLGYIYFLGEKERLWTLHKRN
mgnify:CR=1 FL=1